uniref:Dihydrolipoyllysine-residue succinyltransferase component of 2-oxoglutarate dehydrogenase complex, mitochondrial n=1 Tax=Hirondellea gigas TaxID=1518452 RepID=A0A6A7FWR6_9CRUS
MKSLLQKSRSVWISVRSVRHISLMPHRHRRINRILRTQNSSPFPLNSYRHFASVVLNVPQMGDSVTEGTIIQFQKKVGDYAEVDDIVVVIETDKTSIDVRATEAGMITNVLAEVDDTVNVEQPLVEIDTSAPKPVQETPAPVTTAPTDATPAPEASTSWFSSVKAAATSSPPTPAAKPKPVVVSVPGSRNERRVAMTRMRLRIAQRLKESQNVAAMLTTFNEIDCSKLISMRKAHKDTFLEKHGDKLGFMSAFVKASTLGLIDQPAINAYFDMENKEIVYHDYVDISVAVASPKGLVVPVLRNTEQMSFADIEGSIANYGKQARDGNLALEDMVGGTFTISNGGVFGSLMGTPIINPPQSAILGMHGIFERPIAINGEVVIRPMMYIALTYDHRIVDGREAVLFLRKVKSCVEDPTTMLLDL